jgi:hypothetical protein
MLSIPDRDDKVWYPGVVIKDVPLGAFAGREGNHAAVDVQASFKVGYFIGKSEGGQRVLLFSPLDGGSEALGNVEDSGWVVLVELHHIFGRARGDGSSRSRRGPYGGQKANGHLDQSINGNGRHSLGFIGVVVRAGVILAEPSVDQGVVGGLVVNLEEKELSWLEIRLKLKSNDFERNCLHRKGLRFGHDCSGERVHLVMLDTGGVFIEFCH